jgi:hypothetical protein
MSVTVGGVLVLLGLAITIKGFGSNLKYTILLNVLGGSLVGSGVAILELF